MTETATSDRTVLTGKILSRTVFTATVHAPIEKISICEWLPTLPDPEYQRSMPPGDRAAGHAATDDGRPVSVNVEMIGAGLVVQHYVFETAEKDHCHMVSMSDVLTPAGWTTCQVSWDLRASQVDDETSLYINTVTCYPTAEFMEFIDRVGQTFEEAAAARQAASGDHCSRQTPLFAASIGRHANARS